MILTLCCDDRDVLGGFQALGTLVGIMGRE